MFEFIARKKMIQGRVAKNSATQSGERLGVAHSQHDLTSYFETLVVVGTDSNLQPSTLQSGILPTKLASRMMTEKERNQLV